MISSRSSHGVRIPRLDSALVDWGTSDLSCSKDGPVHRVVDAYRSVIGGLESEHVRRPIGADDDFIAASQFSSPLFSGAANLSSSHDRSAGTASIPQERLISRVLNGEVFTRDVQMFF